MLRMQRREDGLTEAKLNVRDAASALPIDGDAAARRTATQRTVIQSVGARSIVPATVRGPAHLRRSRGRPALRQYAPIIEDLAGMEE